MGDIRYHNVYSNHDVEFMSAVIGNLLDGGLSVNLINGGPDLTKVTKEGLDPKTLARFLSLPAHDVITALGPDRKCVASIVFEKNGKGSSKEDAPAIVQDVLVGQDKFTPLLLDIMRDSARNFEHRPTAFDIMNRGHDDDFDPSYLVKRLTNIISRNQTGANTNRLPLDHKGEKRMLESNGRIAEGIEYICSRFHEVMALDGNKLHNITQRPGDWEVGDVFIIRSNGSVAGIIKVAPYDDENPNRNRVSLLNGVWTTPFNIFDAIARMNGVEDRKVAGGVIDEYALLSHYMRLADSFEYGPLSRCDDGEGFGSHRDIIVDYIFTVFEIIKHRGMDVTRENVHQQYYEEGIATMMSLYDKNNTGRDDKERELVDSYREKLENSAIFQRITKNADKPNKYPVCLINKKIARPVSIAIRLDHKCLTSNLR